MLCKEYDKQILQNPNHGWVKTNIIIYANCQKWVVWLRPATARQIKSFTCYTAAIWYFFHIKLKIKEEIISSFRSRSTYNVIKVWLEDNYILVQKEFGISFQRPFNISNVWLTALGMLGHNRSNFNYLLQNHNQNLSYLLGLIIKLRLKEKVCELLILIVVRTLL